MQQITTELSQTGNKELQEVSQKWVLCNVILGASEIRNRGNTIMIIVKLHTKRGCIMCLREMQLRFTKMIV